MYGIVYDSTHIGGMRGGFYPSGIAVFDCAQSRQEAMDWLAYLGYSYATTYKDTQGPGLSWAFQRKPRPSAQDRLPSVQRARANDRARRSFQRSLYRNPSYDLTY